MEYDGLQEHIRDLPLPEIETWENKYPDRDYWIRIEIPEYTCICPKTGLPDFATITLEYIPDRACVELKSLKLYIHAFRAVGIFHEHATNRILDDFVRAVGPRRLVVTGVFNARGGIATTVKASYPLEDPLRHCAPAPIP